MGELYRGLRLSDEYPVAIKVMSPLDSNTDASAQFERRFKEEMKILRRLRHKHLTAATDYLAVPGLPPTIVMDWVDGRDLWEEVRERGPLPWKIACEVVRQAAEGLGYAWKEFKLVHRDIKPSNVMLTPTGNAVVLDFGLARAALLADSESPSGFASTSHTVGTPEFMAPEQWDDSRRVTARADVYSLGCTFFYLLTGQTPFSSGERGNVSSMAEAHRRLPPPDIRTLRPEVPAKLARVLEQMLAKDPVDRPLNGTIVAKSLQRWAADADLKEHVTSSWASSPASGTPDGTTQRHRGLRVLGRRGFLLVGIAAAGGLAGLAWALRGHYLPPPRVIDFDVSLFRHSGSGAPEKIGQIGQSTFAALRGGHVQLHVRLDTPAYIQFFAANTTGDIQPLVTSTDDDTPVVEKMSGPVADLQFPRQELWQLDDATGLQAFVLIASRQPLPPLGEWLKDASMRQSWTRVTNEHAAWHTQGDVIKPLTLADETPRGQLTKIVPDALDRLWRAVHVNIPATATAELIAFPVMGG
jgi:hypothetical protein